MATDATGTPTSLGIPKFNTSVDNPSGLGFNAAMDALDDLLVSAPLSGEIAGIAVGSVPVWDGSAWVKPTGTPDGTKFLRDDGAWATPDGNLSYGTSLPGSPSDGDEAILVDSTTAPTYQWRFRYNAGSASSNKWEFIGGVPASDEVTTSQTTTSTTYTNLATTGPSVVLPLAGNYLVSIGTYALNSNTNNSSRMSYAIGATAASDNDCIIMDYTNNAVAANEAGNLFRVRLKAGLTAVTLTAKYRVTAGTGTFSNRFMSVTPVAVA